MKVLELWDVSGDEPEPAGASAAITPTGLKFTGTGLQAILSRYMDEDMGAVFNKLNGWSNGYIALKLKGGE